MMEGRLEKYDDRADKFFNNDLNLSLSVDKPVTEKDTIKFANGKQLNKNGGNNE